MAHRVVADNVRPGDVVVDATLGNGHDTLFLARCVGNSGKVYGFDVQQDAINATHGRLAGAGVAEQVYQLHLEGHENMADYVPEEVQAVMFNLGYLPGGDKRRITQLVTTLLALQRALELLSPGGVVTVMCYPGHEGGEAESEAVSNLLSSAQREGFALECFERDGTGAASPFLLVARKTASSR